MAEQEVPALSAHTNTNLLKIYGPKYLHEKSRSQLIGSGTPDKHKLTIIGLKWIRRAISLSLHQPLTQHGTVEHQERMYCFRFFFGDKTEWSKHPMSQPSAHCLKYWILSYITWGIDGTGRVLTDGGS